MNAALQPETLARPNRSADTPVRFGKPPSPGSVAHPCQRLALFASSLHIGPRFASAYPDNATPRHAPSVVRSLQPQPTEPLVHLFEMEIQRADRGQFTLGEMLRDLGIFHQLLTEVRPGHPCVFRLPRLHRVALR